MKEIGFIILFIFMLIIFSLSPSTTLVYAIDNKIDNAGRIEPKPGHGSELLKKKIFYKEDNKKQKAKKKEVIDRTIKLEDIKKTKEQILKYKKALLSPPIIKGNRTLLPYIPDTQTIHLAVGYGTVIKTPFPLREKNGYIIGNAKAFKIVVLDKDELVIYPLVRFWRTNVFLFPDSENQNSYPVILLAEEVTDNNAFVDFLVEIKNVNNEITANDLLDIALYGSFQDTGINKMRSPIRKQKQGFKDIFILKNPNYIIVSLDGDWKCLRGCDVYVNDPSNKITVAGVYPNAKAEFCEKKNSKFVARKCVVYQ